MASLFCRMAYEQITKGIRVRVQPRFSLAQSDLVEGRFVFTYRVEMDNESPDAAQLLFRHWHIHDAGGEDSVLDGEGVVGEQPTIQPGEQHSYQSFCILRSPVGFMEGYYTFVRPNGEEFRVAIPKFDLEAPWGTVDEDAEMN